MAWRLTLIDYLASFLKNINQNMIEFFVFTMFIFVFAMFMFLIIIIIDPD